MAGLAPAKPYNHACHVRLRQTIAYSNVTSYTNRSLSFKEEKSRQERSYLDPFERSLVAFTLYFQYGGGGRHKIVSVGSPLTPSRKKSAGQTWRTACLPLIVCTVLLIAGCVRQQGFPPMGDPLPSTVKLEMPPSLKDQILRYTDSCGQPEEIPLGRRLEDALLEGAYRTFTKVAYEEPGGAAFAPDHVVKVDFLDWSFDLNKDALYDRAPAVLKLNAITRVYDKTGALLRETEIKVSRQERLRLEQLAKNCDYIIDPFIRDTLIEFASRVFLDTRIALGEQPPSPPIARIEGAGSETSPPAVEPLSAAAPPTLSKLRFKALLLDENGNLILEGGEHVRVRVDVVNTGMNPIQDASATLTGTLSIIGQFPATTLSIPPLQPGQTKSLEFMATLPPATQPQQAEIHVAVTESGGAAAPPQTLSLTIQPAGAGADDVDQIPAPASNFQQPQTYLVSIGVGSYRDRQMQPRKYASRDAETIANYFQSLGGIPPSNVRLLQNWKALRTDMDEVLLDWLPLHSAKNAVVILYFSGQAVVTPTGNVLLAPYDGTTAAPTRLYPLKDIESSLARLKAKHVIFLFDGVVSRLRGDAKTKVVAPRWELGSPNITRLIGGEEFTKGLEDDKHRHGLFTYYLLKGLRGDADTNRDGVVTLWETAEYVRQKVSWAARTRFNVEQRPQILPILKPGDPAGSLALTKLASLTGTEPP
jgi:hypothetical protein